MPLQQRRRGVGNGGDEPINSDGA
ncbi:hypothetical protein A2U01_0115463, partial [Trifolium medium]|nr:hypothetical protein [Trifolium medium]